eukprot:gb/GEZN01009451.1/.p1 GENE.gb/GEZN01009451.1/~~gb/GEZN01009451.1/.p1  ORF type:complete len:128 (+),score=15.66 gb/GEZN01009451.1/:604-987(+)
MPPSCLTWDLTMVVVDSVSLFLFFVFLLVYGVFFLCLVPPEFRFVTLTLVVEIFFSSTIAFAPALHWFLPSSLSSFRFSPWTCASTLVVVNSVWFFLSFSFFGLCGDIFLCSWSYWDFFQTLSVYSF